MEVVAIFFVSNLVTEHLGFLLVPRGFLVHAGHPMRPSERLVGEGEVPLLDVVGIRLADLETPPRVVQRRLRAPEHRVDARDLPLAAGAVLRLALRCLGPMVGRGVRRVQHPLVVRPRLHQAPDLVEELDSE